MDTQHIHIDKQSPEAYQALVGVSTAVARTAHNAGLPRALVELVNVRVSQINGCPSCLEVHNRRAVSAGVTDKQLATLSVWRDTELFDEHQQAALRLAEITTTLPDHDTAEREYARGQKGVHRRPTVRGDLGGDRDQRVQPGVDSEQAPGQAVGAGVSRTRPHTRGQAPTPTGAPSPG